MFINNTNLKYYSHIAIIHSFYMTDKSDKYIWDFFKSILLRDYPLTNGIKNKHNYDSFF